MIFLPFFLIVLIVSIAADTLGGVNRIFYLLSFLTSLLLLMIIFLFARDDDFYMYFSIAAVLMNMLASGYKFFASKKPRL